ncbi:hypothetical protein WUBG_12700 [Wuchereria bancrofti]|uniref:Low-density lipoprotein receptor domain class A containing protein n=1 Tax=Wuchereria bancrofti TaxID=6293 RepID=J9APW7_WUCBA|nr:hypothetical protein WUBG_12700 [Wuchereria bancrofti]
MSNTIDDNDRNENYHNRRNDISSYDPSENRQFKELTGRITGIEHDRTNSLQELSLNDENMLNHGSNYESESLSATAINGDSSYDRDASNSFRHNEAKHENYHSGITYGRAEIRHETNETSHSNQNSNGIDEKDEEDTDECSDQEFRCPYLPKTLCVHYMKICDGIDDCGDGSDEMNCGEDELVTLANDNSESLSEIATGSCKPDQFRCENGKCIAQVDHCNHKYDCDDGTDEITCEYFVQALQQARRTTMHPDEIIPIYATTTEQQKFDQVEDDRGRQIQEEEQERLRGEKEQKEQEQKRLRQEQERQRYEQERRHEEEEQRRRSKRENGRNMREDERRKNNGNEERNEKERNMKG